ncbi:PTS ascorbate transporter subunit IIA [[Pantoea] beijingensis]|uniref:PTS ascorbate transporter subunit IIA n=1 Tax=[Pantoea] beijingensis TaxID=1324864 RepID=A0A443IB19_9GAMM|nr:MULTISPECIES: PTS sugar transporter subunit IIA [Erwiniaceae]RWR01284.1 PTS ascorbate transporter subunit IIA [[Pantoea] beijingensis]
MLNTWLNDDTIQLAHSFSDWKQALACCAAPLLQKGIITPRYVEAILESHQKLGPYYVLAPGLAMPHARPEDGATALGLSLLKLEQGVSFGAEEHDPVDVIIMLAAPDKNSHIDLITGLAEMFSSDETMEKLHRATRIEEIKQLISAF